MARLGSKFAFQSRGGAPRHDEELRISDGQTKSGRRSVQELATLWGRSSRVKGSYRAQVATLLEFCCEFPPEVPITTPWGAALRTRVMITGVFARPDTERPPGRNLGSRSEPAPGGVGAWQGDWRIYSRADPTPGGPHHRGRSLPRGRHQDSSPHPCRSSDRGTGPGATSQQGELTPIRNSHEARKPSQGLTKASYPVNRAAPQHT